MFQRLVRKGGERRFWMGGGQTTGGLGLGDGVPQRGPGAEPRLAVWGTKSPEAEEFLK